MQEMHETRVQFLVEEDSLEEEMATHSGILSWRNPWTEEPLRLQSVHRVAKSGTQMSTQTLLQGH